MTGLALAILLAQHSARGDETTVSLGTASSFAVLAGSGITVAGAVDSTTITGDIGTFPTTSITGLENVVLLGVNHAGDAVTQTAKNDLTAAYNDAAGRTYNTLFAGGYDLVGRTLNAGVYNDGSSLFLSGTLTLDAQGNPNAVFIFQTGSTLITASASKVNLINGAQACHVFWQVGSSATLGTGTDFEGNILAAQSITVDTGSQVNGRALAENGAVTLDSSSVTKAVCLDDVIGGATVPDVGSTLLMALMGFGAIFFFKPRQAISALAGK